VLVVPEPCEIPTDEQVSDHVLMITRGDYPGVDAMLSAYEYHCCQDDALAKRPPTPNCLPDSD
jgi:hypothetical protein